MVDFILRATISREAKLEVLLTTVVFGVAMTGMAIGVIVSNRRLRGSCGGPDIVTSDGHSLSCGACPKNEAAICPSDDPLIQLAQISHPVPPEHR